MAGSQSSEKSLQEIRDASFGMGFRQMETVQGDGRDIGAYGRSRSAGVDTLFEYQPIWGLDPLRWDTDLTDGDSVTSFNAVTRVIDMQVGSLSQPHIARRSSRPYMPHQPGKSLQVTMVGQFSTGVNEVTGQIGYFDDNDGIFFGVATDVGSVVTTSWTLRSSASGSIVDTVVPQEEWNLDTLIQRPGGPTRQNPSNINLDVTQYQIIVIDLQPKIGRIRVGFNIGGVIHYVHEFQSSNVLGVPSMATSQLPLRYEIRATFSSLSTKAFMRQSYCSAISEGGDLQNRGLVFSASSGATLFSQTGDAAEKHVISIKPADMFRGVRNHVPLTPSHFTVITRDQELAWALRLNPIVPGVYASADPNSSAEVNTTSGNVVGGTLIDSGFVAIDGGDKVGVVKIPVPGDLMLGRDIIPSTLIDNFDRMTLSISRIAGNDTQYGGSATWREHQ